MSFGLRESHKVLPKIKKCECGKVPAFTNVVHPRVECVCGNYVECNWSARETIHQWNRRDYQIAETFN